MKIPGNPAFSGVAQLVLIQDGHSSYHRQAAALINEWTHKLAEEQVELQPADAIGLFEMQKTGIPDDC